MWSPFLICSNFVSYLSGSSSLFFVFLFVRRFRKTSLLSSTTSSFLSSMTRSVCFVSSMSVWYQCSCWISPRLIRRLAWQHPSPPCLLLTFIYFCFSLFLLVNFSSIFLWKFTSFFPPLKTQNLPLFSLSLKLSKDSWIPWLDAQCTATPTQTTCC